MPDGHIFTGINGQTFLPDTGAPNSFGTDSSVTLNGRIFNLPSMYQGLSASGLSNLVQNLITGIPGADIVNHKLHPVLWDAMQKETCTAAWQTEPG